MIRTTCVLLRQLDRNAHGGETWPTRMVDMPRVGEHVESAEGTRLTIQCITHKTIEMEQPGGGGTMRVPTIVVGLGRYDFPYEETT